MKTFSLCLTIFFLNLTVGAQNDLHKSALNYFVKVTNNTKDAYYIMVENGKMVANYAEIASQTESFKLDKLRVDSLKNSFSLLISILQSNTIKLDSLSEVDSTIRLKDSVKSIYKDAILSFKKVIPKFLTLFEFGYMSTSKEEITNYWSEFQLSMKSIFNKIDALGKSTSTFLIKYSIEDSELKQNGL